MFLCLLQVLQYNQRHDCLFYWTITTFVTTIIPLYLFIYLFILFIWDNGNKGEWLQKIDPRLRQSPLLHVDKVTWQRPVVAIEKVGNMGL